MPIVKCQMPTVGSQMPDTGWDGPPLSTEPTDFARRRIRSHAGPVMSSGLFGSVAGVCEDHGLRRRTYSTCRYGKSIKSSSRFN